MDFGLAQQVDQSYVISIMVIGNKFRQHSK